MSWAGRSAWPLRRFSALAPRLIAIGASTGGPQAISGLLTRLAPRLGETPVVVVLHMPKAFTDVVASDIGRLTGLPTTSPRNGESLKPGHIYFAPGGVHLKVVRVGALYALAYSDTPPENFCKPAVDVLFRSVADAYGAGALAVVLTGMGADGLSGARKIVEAGGSVVAQDEASSAVWGMPGEIARAGIASAVLPVDAMADAIGARLIGGARRPK
ncbi:MAG: chemotaxis protein CheB [Hyphomicrobiales bacterium]|nr:chemotaxis protein CheB [Hyphomicrobiales bacterium]